MTDKTGSSSTNSVDTGKSSASSPLRLKGAQRRIANAYADADSGLFVLNCVAGAGKSVTQDDIVAKELLRQWVDGDRTPEQRICVITFNRNEAASSEADIIDRLQTLVSHNLTEAATKVSQEELEELIQRVRHAPYIGTIDSVLQTLFSDIVADVGFAETPAVGSKPLLEQIHKDCYEALVSDPEHNAALQRLQDAYPQREHHASVDDLLRDALCYCRSHQLLFTEFKTRLGTSIESVYAEGEPTSVDDITAAIARCVSDQAAQSALDTLNEEDRQALVDGDRDLYHSWQDRIEDFCTLLAAYQTEYDSRIRDQGVISHLDCAYLVAEYFGDTPTSESDGNIDSNSQRTRVLERHRARIESWIIDEAQDLSIIQHSALAPFVTPQNRVAVAGDVRQCIYGWRDAHPELFASAVSDGTYFGIDWEPHIVETATRTYRCRPAVAAAINAIAKPALTDPLRGNLGDLDIAYPHLEPVREPTDEPSVHIASFAGAGTPGTDAYIAPERKKGEAEILATYIACGLADGSLSVSETKAKAPREINDNERHTDCEVHESSPAVTVLFRRRQYMDRYAEAFDAQELSVVNASEPLFDCPSVEAVVAVIEWLIDPVETGRIQSLIENSVFDAILPTDIFERHDWDLDEVLNTDVNMTDQQAALLTRLRAIRDSRGIQHAYPAPELAEEIIATLELRADSYDIADTVSPAQRVANLDAFSEWLQTLDIGEIISPDQFIELVRPFRQDPQDGPTQAVTPSTTGDVEFRTIHQMKGDEAPIIALADLGFDIWFPGSPNQRLITSGDVAALAPPETGQVPHLKSLSVFTGGLYNPALSSRSTQTGTSPATNRQSPRDVGLRWATERWHGTEDSSARKLVGHTHLQTVARNSRAEAWRLLYVALTRARDHLIVPLPREGCKDSLHDRWLDAIQDGLEYDGSLTSGYSIDCPVSDGNSTRSVGISVNDVSSEARSHKTTIMDSNRNTSKNSLLAGTVPLTQLDLQPFIPRIVRPSTLAPLISDPDKWVLNHLQNEELHTAADTTGDLPLDFEWIRPAEIGELYHDILASVISHAVSETSAVTDEHELRAIAIPIIDNRYPDHPQSVRHDLLSFLSEWILPQLMQSDCWQRIKNADQVYIEKSVSDLIRISDVEFEFDGTIDVVLESAEDNWEVIDLKITLGELVSETRYRYQLQTEAYAYLLNQEVENKVESCVETFGVECTTITSDGSPDDLLKCLQTLYRNAHL